MRLRSFLGGAGLLFASFAAHADTYTMYTVGASSGNLDNIGFTNGGQSFVVAPSFCQQAGACYHIFTPPNGVQYTASEPTLDDGNGPGTYAWHLTPYSGPNSTLSVVNLFTGASTDVYTGDIGDPMMNSFGDIAFLIYNDPQYQLDDVNALAVNETAHAAVTPEPSSFALLGTGLLGVAGVVKRRLS